MRSAICMLFVVGFMGVMDGVFLGWDYVGIFRDGVVTNPDRPAVMIEAFKTKNKYAQARMHLITG